MDSTNWLADAEFGPTGRDDRCMKGRWIRLVIVVGIAIALLVPVGIVVLGGM